MNVNRNLRIGMQSECEHNGEYSGEGNGWEPSMHFTLSNGVLKHFVGKVIVCDLLSHYLSKK